MYPLTLKETKSPFQKGEKGGFTYVTIIKTIGYKFKTLEKIPLPSAAAEGFAEIIMESRTDILHSD